MRHLRVRLLAVLVCVAGFARPAFSQNTITLEGRAVSAGAPVAGAQVTAVNIATQETARATTRPNGEFRLLGLFAGEYTVAVRAIGFKPVSQGVQLVIGQRARLEFAMEKGVAELTAVNVVTELVKPVEVRRLSVSAPVLKEEIENLPLNSRGVMNLAAIAPGIKTYAPQSGRTIPSGGGAPDLRFINLYMDGVEMKSLFNGNLVGIPQTGSPLPQEALEQFRVYTNPYDAEYSRAGSYVISAESRRGTNKWEGSAFGFFQNKSFVTKNAFQNTVPDYSREQFGLNLRGPLQKDRLFLAASYEVAKTDNFLDVNPTRSAAAPAKWDQYRGAFKAPNTNHTFFTRLTYVQDPHSTWDGMASVRLMKGESFFGGLVARDGGITQDYKIYTGQLRHRYLGGGGNFVNELSAQTVIWNHNEAPLVPGPQRSYPGITLGTSGFPLILKETHLRLVDRATWTVDNSLGTHVIKAGVELSSIAAKQDFANNKDGSFLFRTDTSQLPYLASIAVGFTDPGSTVDAVANATGVVTGAYLNDEWAIQPNFTLSLGLRHDAELNTLNNKYTVPWAADPVLQAIPELAGYLNVGDRKNNLTNFSPRVSFAWDPTRQNRTFVRGGFGIIYDRVTSFIGFQERKNSTWRTYNFSDPGTIDPAALRARVLAGSSGSPAPILVKHEMKTPRNTQLSIGVGHQLSEEFGVNLDYVRQHLDNLYVQRNPNYLDVSVTPGVRKLTPKYGDILLWDDIGTADYSAVLMQLTWQRRRTRVNLAYTLGWYEGNFDTGGLPNFAFTSLFNTQRTSGDERHRVVISEVSPIPFGFLLSSIATIASPRPFVTIDGRDLNKDNIIADDFPDGNRTTLPSQNWENWYRTVDVRLSRPLYAWDGRKVSITAEIFNLFNWSSNQNYGSRMRDATGAAVPNFGLPTSAFAARQAQVGMRVDW